MKIGELWFLREPNDSWLLYHLLTTNPVDKDVVVVVSTEPYDDDVLVTYMSTITGEKDFMRREDFERTFIKTEELNEK